MRATSALARLSMVVSGLAWATTVVLVCTASVGLSWQGEDLGIITTWLMGVAALTLLLPMTGGDKRIDAVLTRGLRLGDAELDDILIADAPRRWRAIPWVRAVLTNVASIAWVLSLVYSIQLGRDVYETPASASLGILRVLMAAAVWPTVVVVSGRAEARQRAMYDLACTGHAALRRNCTLPAQAHAPGDVALEMLDGGGEGPFRHRNGGTAGNGRVVSGA